ncbi:glutamate receptor ionotropic, kainate glr-3-like [Palaemon carinicauda]|uniref:glutamate receptor ionotropic, kainate glr-3-like n=1 Tax=Palaemon carinicauda TaxID=392227 RepID=UPI0035B575A3
MALTGRHLIVGAQTWNPWVKTTDASLGYTGILYKVLNTIANKLNFTYSVISPADRQWGRELPNGSFSGMIGMCQRKEVDLALGPFALSWSRSKAADFSSVFHFDDYGILTPRPEREADLSGFAKPLSWQVWVSLAIAVIISLVVGLIINYITDHVIKVFLHPNEVTSLEMIEISWITKVMLAEAVSPLPKKNTGRIYILSWMIIGFIIHAAYSSILISLLAVPKVPIPVDSLEDLLAYGKYPWVMIKGSHLHAVMQETDSQIYKKTLDRAILLTDYVPIEKREPNAYLTVVITIKQVVILR